MLYIYNKKPYIRDEPFNIYRGVPKNDKKIVCRRRKLEKKLFAISLSEKKIVCMAILKILRILKYPLVAKMPFCCN